MNVTIAGRTFLQNVGMLGRRVGQCMSDETRAALVPLSAVTDTPVVRWAQCSWGPVFVGPGVGRLHSSYSVGSRAPSLSRRCPRRSIASDAALLDI